MNKTIAERELIVLGSPDTAVQATYHKSREESSELRPIKGSPVGIVFLNGLAATRAGNGDAAVYWADSFAESGYPSFRLDLPGYGDSDGDPPENWLDFINLGGYASVASANICELVARFNLSGVVIVGHCAGAVSAIFSAAVATRECRGLVLMDPYFHFRQVTRPKIRTQMSLWAMQSAFGGFLSSFFDLLKKIRLSLRRNVLPANANLSLLRCWKEVASTGLPILILKAPSLKTQGAKPRAGEFDYFRHVVRLAGRKGKVVIRSIDGANHSFANRLGRTAVCQQVEQWLNACFPSVKPEENAVSILHSKYEDSSEYELQENCSHG